MLPNVLSCYVIMLLIRRIESTDCYASSYMFHYNILDNSGMKCLACTKFLEQSMALTELICSMDDKRSSTSFSYIMRQHGKLPALRIRSTQIQKSEPFILSPDLEEPGWTWSNLLKLDVSGNNISEVVHNFFSIFPDLIELNMNDNEITSITENTFYVSLTKLQRLNLSRNIIENIHESSFQSQLDLFVIDLSNNKIKYIPSKIFDNQRNLELVVLNNNRIVDFDISFRNSSPFIITSIDLSFNRLNTIHFMGDVLNVNLSNNNLTEIPRLNPYIMSLNVSHNSIQYIENNLFLKLSNLRMLDLGYNFLESLPTNSFRNSRLLEYIDISHNILNENMFGTKNNWISFFFHFDKLNTVSLDGNMWGCSDLKDILQSLKNKNVKITAGDEHSKSNILGISCIDSDDKNDNSSSVPVDNKSIIDRIIKQVENYFENSSTSGKQIARISARMDQLENDINKKISNIETRKSSVYLEKQININNNHSTALINEINYMMETGISKLTKRIDEIQNDIKADHPNPYTKLNEEYINKLSQYEHHANPGSSVSEIIIIILLISVLGFLIFFWYTRRKLSPSVRQDGINLVDTNC